MIARHASAVDIDDVHSAAIRKEIGQRLDRYYKSELPEAPAELEQLVARLRQLDSQTAPRLAESPSGRPDRSAR
jgi:hypothetical protein